jgi:hypothetical protein
MPFTDCLPFIDSQSALNFCKTTDTFLRVCFGTGVILGAFG